MVTLKEALAMGIKVLKEAQIETPVVDAGVLLCHAAGCDRAYLYAHGEQPLDEGSYAEFASYLRMRAGGAPVQYITGRCGFMSLDFKVGPGVLVPRPETELLVETAARILEAKGKPARVLDIGTGSGCIAVSIASLLKNCTVTAVDISEPALETARRNAEYNGVSDRIEFVRGDLFEGLEGLRFDAVLSNPPYVRSGDIPKLQREVRDFEPIGALDGGPDGLHYYRRIVEESPRCLCEQGLLAFEAGYGQSSEVASLMDRFFTNIGVTKDLAGIDRVITGILKKQ